jgi:hypothetical protein
VIKRSNIRRPTVELAPSRIRREPPAAAPARKSVQPYPSERETWVVAIGVVLFAIAIAIITVGVSNFTAN